MREIVFSQEEIKQSCQRIGAALTKDLQGEEKMPVLVGAMKGALNFFYALLPYIEVPCILDFFEAHSYSGTKSTGQLKVVRDIEENVEDRTVVLVEDIVDTGLSMSKMLQMIEMKNPKRVIVVSLFDKAVARTIPVRVDYCGKVLTENKFLVGFGLDCNEFGRDVPYVYVPDEEEIKKMEEASSR